MKKKLTDNIELVVNDTKIVCTYEESIAALLNTFNEKKLSQIKLLKTAVLDLEDDEILKLMQFYLDISMAKNFLSLSEDELSAWCKKYPETNVHWLVEKEYDKAPCPNFLRYVQIDEMKPELALERLILIHKKSDLVASLKWSHIKKINDDISVETPTQRKLLRETMESIWFFGKELSCAIRNSQESELAKMWERVVKKVFVENLKAPGMESDEEAYHASNTLLNGVPEIFNEKIKNKDWYELLKSSVEVLVENYKAGKLAYGQETILNCLINQLVSFKSKSFLNEPVLAELSEIYIVKKDKDIFIAEALLGNLYYAHRNNLDMVKGVKEKWIIDSNSKFSFAEIYQVKKAIVESLKDAYPQYAQDFSLKLNGVMFPQELAKSSLMDEIIDKFKECVKNGYPKNIAKEVDILITQKLMNEDIGKRKVQVTGHKVKKF